MNVFLLRDEELHITMMNPVMKILISGVVFVGAESSPDTN
jgi:hypothetical protein